MLENELTRQSIIEELQAINAYESRIDALTGKTGFFTSDKISTLRKILIHNMSEEKEHVAMLVEWLRKYDTVQNEKFEKHD
jgi:uncharacterized protein